MKIFHKLLPLATGYFGVSSALYEFDGLVVIYGPAGGAWHINIEDEPRWYRGPATVVGAGLLEMDVILGNEDKFIGNIATVATGLNRRFVALAGTPISEIIGTDLKGFARTLEARTGWSTKKFVTTARRYRTVQIRAGNQTLTAADPLSPDLAEALDALKGAH